MTMATPFCIRSAPWWRGLCAGVLCVGAPWVQAQPSPFMGDAPPFVDQARNVVESGPAGRALQGWHDALDHLLFQGEGQVNVVHIGGSHLQADLWSQQARQRLSQLAPGIRSARGAAFPYGLARTNNPWWYQVDGKGAWSAVRNVTRGDTSLLGLTGISITTLDTAATVRLFPRKDGDVPFTPFQRVRVLHRMDSAFSVHAWSSDTTLQILRTVHPEEGFTAFAFNRAVDTLQLRFTRSDSTARSFTLLGLLLDSEAPGLVYHAIGVNGASTASYLRCQRFTADLALIAPQLVIFSVGINDAHDAEFDPARFKRNYAGLIARVRAAAPGASILLTTNSDSYFKRRVANRNAFKVREVMRELAVEEGVAVWDLFGVMGGLGSIAKWEAGGLAQKDRIHLNRKGYTLLGDLQIAALMEAYGEHLKRSARP